jgi:hypothetical protein
MRRQQEQKKSVRLLLTNWCKIASSKPRQGLSVKNLCCLWIYTSCYCDLEEKKWPKRLKIKKWKSILT